MGIDKFVPVSDVSKNYSIAISAPVEKVYSALKNCDVHDSPVIRFLFLLRGLPVFFKSLRTNSGKRRLTINDIAGSGFMLLDEKTNEEIVIGVVGRFWQLTGNIQHISSEHFVEFEERGFAKAAWNFFLKPEGVNKTLLTTETRIRCTDESSRRKFKRYWAFIGPFSGIIRKEMLRIIKRDAEK